MALYCKKCQIWQDSTDENSSGDRWCSYSRRYEEADQNTYGCRGFEEGDRSYSGRSSSGCFLTTACVEHRGLPDDCRELTVLRAFRDGWLAKQKDGQEEIRAYYRLAPAVVERIKARTDAAEVLEEMYQRYILPCVAHVEAGEMKETYALYKELLEKASKLS